MWPTSRTRRSPRFAARGLALSASGGPNSASINTASPPGSAGRRPRTSQARRDVFSFSAAASTPRRPRPVAIPLCGPQLRRRALGHVNSIFSTTTKTSKQTPHGTRATLRITDCLFKFNTTLCFRAQNSEYAALDIVTWTSARSERWRRRTARMYTKVCRDLTCSFRPTYKARTATCCVSRKRISSQPRLCPDRSTGTASTCGSSWEMTGALPSASSFSVCVQLGFSGDASAHRNADETQEEKKKTSRTEREQICHSRHLSFFALSCLLICSLYQTTCALHPVTVRTCLQHLSQPHQRIRAGSSCATKQTSI